MRCFSLALGSALLTSTLAAHADTVIETLTISGTTILNTSGFYGVTSNAFSEFNPTLGTLDSVTVSFTGTASGPALDPNNPVPPDNFTSVTVTDHPNTEVFSVSGSGYGTFNISLNKSESYDLSDFEGAGTQSLILDFSDPGSASATGNVTYTYDPIAAGSPTPEPSSLVLVGNALIGFAGKLRKRFQ